MKPHKLSTFQMRHAALTCGFVKPIDTSGMLGTLARLRGSALRGRALAGALFIMLTAMNVSPAVAKDYKTMNIKLYAYNKLNWDQFQCYNWLIHHESRWNYKARNHSHWGLGQMRSKWYGTLNPLKQVDVHLEYINHRYNGKPCLALKHWENKGWH